MSKYTFDADIFSDLYKDVHGIRPRGHEFYTASDERKQEIWDFTLKCLEQEIKEMDARKERAEEAFAALVVSTMKQGAADEDTAVRWLLEGEGVEPAYTEGDYVAYCFDLPYSSKWVHVFNRVLRGMRDELELLED